MAGLAAVARPWSDRFRENRLVEGREQPPWPAIAAILVIARLCEPSSELHIAEDWYRRTALDDLLGGRPSGSTMTGCTARSTICCRTSKPWRPTSRSAWERCSISTMICCVYDVTSTYFEGQAEANGLARRGYSRDHRGDCKQVCIGLVVTRAACRSATRCSPATAPT